MCGVCSLKDSPTAIHSTTQRSFYVLYGATCLGSVSFINRNKFIENAVAEHKYLQTICSNVAMPPKWLLKFALMEL